MKMTRILLTMMMFIMPFAAEAQRHDGPPPHRPEKREDLEAMKVAFLTRKLDLTPEEAQAFWPVYNQFQKKMEELRKSRKEDFKKYREQMETLTEKDFETMADNEIAFRQKEVDLIKEYHSKFKTSLPAKKVGLLYIAEEQWKVRLVEIIRKG